MNPSQLGGTLHYNAGVACEEFLSGKISLSELYFELEGIFNELPQSRKEYLQDEPRALAFHQTKDHILLYMSNKQIMVLDKAKLWADCDFTKVELFEHGHVLKLGSRILNVFGCYDLTPEQKLEDGVAIIT